MSFPAVYCILRPGSGFFRARFARRKNFPAPLGINFPARDLRNRGTRPKKAFPAPPRNQERFFPINQLARFQKKAFPGKNLLLKRPVVSLKALPALVKVRCPRHCTWSAGSLWTGRVVRLVAGCLRVSGPMQAG